MMLRLAPTIFESSAHRPITWDDTACPLCGQRADELVMEAADPTPGDGSGLRFAVVRCRLCEMRYTNPRPDEASIGRFYPLDYRPHRAVRKPSRGGITAARVKLLPMIGLGRLLDFGCGSGAFLTAMAERGWHVTGLDPAAAKVRDGLPSDILAGSLPHPDLRPGSFDAVTMWHSLEHVHRPLAVLREAFQLLVPGGKLVVAVPNAECWAARAFGPNWFGLDVPRHLVHFSPTTLRAMLTAAGFAVEAMTPVRHSDWLRSSAKLAARDQSTPGWQTLLTWKPLAKLFAGVSSMFGSCDTMTVIAHRPG